MAEEWRDVPGYEGLYQVSNHGRIKSYDKYVTCVRYGKEYERLRKGRIIKQSKNKYGYLTLASYKEGKQKNHRVHRLVLTAFDRPPKQKEQCNHKDGDKSNNFKEKLEWCTHRENCDHRDNVLEKHNIGRFIGEKNGNSELTENKVREIRVLLKEGKLTQQQIADRYKVGQATINRIKTGKSWKHIK